MPHNDKLCRSCGQHKPLREFTLPRHRVCTACRERAGVPQVTAWLYATEQIPSPVMPLTSTREGYNAWQRARYRAVHPTVPTKPKDPTAPLKPRLCRRCHQIKPATMFKSPRWRLCIACDGPV